MSKQCTAALNCYVAKALSVKYISAHSSQTVACSQTRFVNLLSAKVLNAPISGMPYFQPLGLDGIGGEYQLLMEQALIPGGTTLRNIPLHIPYKYAIYLSVVHSV